MENFTEPIQSRLREVGPIQFVGEVALVLGFLGLAATVAKNRISAYITNRRTQKEERISQREDHAECTMFRPH